MLPTEDREILSRFWIWLLEPEFLGKRIRNRKLEALRKAIKLLQPVQDGDSRLNEPVRILEEIVQSYDHAIYRSPIAQLTTAGMPGNVEEKSRLFVAAQVAGLLWPKASRYKAIKEQLKRRGLSKEQRAVQMQVKRFERTMGLQAQQVIAWQYMQFKLFTTQVRAHTASKTTRGPRTAYPLLSSRRYRTTNCVCCKGFPNRGEDRMRAAKSLASAILAQSLLRLGELQFWQRVDNCHRLQADGDDLADQADDVFAVVGAVGVVGDAAALVGRDLVLVDDPLQGRAVAEAVFEGLGRDAGQREEVVVDERGLVLAEAHLLHAPVRVVPFSTRSSGYSGCCS